MVIGHLLHAKRFRAIRDRTTGLRQCFTKKQKQKQNLEKSFQILFISYFLRWSFSAHIAKAVHSVSPPRIQISGSHTLAEYTRHCNTYQIDAYT